MQSLRVTEIDACTGPAPAISLATLPEHRLLRSVVSTRATSIDLQAMTRLACAVASPARTSSTICAIVKPRASMSASVQPVAAGGEQLERAAAVGLGGRGDDGGAGAWSQWWRCLVDALKDIRRPGTFRGRTGVLPTAR